MVKGETEGFPSFIFSKSQTERIKALREVGGTGRVMTLMELNTYFLRLPTEPYFGSYGGDESAK
jgi:hypothetical protein